MIKANQGFEALLHSLLPAKLREELKPNTAAYIRARALIAMLLAVTAMGAFSVLVLVVIHLLTNAALLKYDLIPAGVLLMLLVQTAMFYRYCNYWISGLAFTNFYFLGVVLLLILAGGYEFHGKSLLLTCPMIAFVIGSRQEGIQNALLSIVFFWALVFLYSIGFKLPNIFYVQDQHVIFIVNWTFTIAVIAITLLVYEAELQGRDAYEFLRVKILTILLRVATAFCFFAAFLIMAVDLAFHPEQFKYDAMILVIALCFALQTWLFYKFNNQDFSGTLLAYFTFVVIVIVVLLSGGYESPVTALMFICPIGFFMISGTRDGVISSILIAIIGIVLCYLSKSGYQFTDFFHDRAPHITSGIVWFIVVIAIMICMMTYDTELEKL